MNGTHLELVPTPREHWVRVGVLRRTLRAAGFSVSTPDAQCAPDLAGYLAATDRVFRRIAAAAGLRLAP